MANTRLSNSWNLVKLNCSMICDYCRGNSYLNAMEVINEDDVELIPDEDNNTSKKRNKWRKHYFSGIYS